MTLNILMRLAGAAALTLSSMTAQAAAPPSAGTIAVISAPGGGRDETLETIAREATTAALGDKGFTILDDRDHAAYIAEVATTRSAVGTSVARTRGEGPAVMGAGVNIPLSRDRSTLVTMQRVMIEIRIHKRGDAAVLWHGAAVTVRPGTAAARLAAQLSRAALNAYPAVVETAISIP